MPELTITETLLIVACCLISILQIAIMYEISSIREELKKHYRTEADNIKDIKEELQNLNKKL